MLINISKKLWKKNWKIVLQNFEKNLKFVNLKTKILKNIFKTLKKF